MNISHSEVNCYSVVLCALQANVGEAHVKEPAFIRALMTAICTSAITGIVHSLSSGRAFRRNMLNESAVYFGGTSCMGPKIFE